MHVLVTYGTKMDGTKEIAQRIADTLGGEHFHVTLSAARDTTRPEKFDAVVLGSAVYALRWRPDAIRLLRRLSNLSYTRPVWLFHSGPIRDDEADEPQKFPTKVKRLAENLDARGWATFGGRLPEDATGYVAKSMVKQGRAGDWRDFDEIELWAKEIAQQLDMS